MKCDVSFSQGSVSTLFRWGEHVFHVCVKMFFLLTAVQKLSKSNEFFPELCSQMYCHIFIKHSVHVNYISWFYNHHRAGTHCPVLLVDQEVIFLSELWSRFSSALWNCWFGERKDNQSVKNMLQIEICSIERGICSTSIWHPRLGVTSLEFCRDLWHQKTRQTDRQTDGQNYNSRDHASIAVSCSKN